MRKEAIIGLALCNLDESVKKVSEVEGYQDYVNQQLRAGYPIEIQYESNEFDLQISKEKSPLLGFHLPIWGVDVMDEEHAEQRQTRLAPSLDMAQSAAADYVVLHLSQHDNWEKLKDGDIEENRELMYQAGLDSYREISRYYKKNGHSYALCVEIPLEYPKHPAGADQILACLDDVKKINPQTKFVFDVAHDWHNMVALLPDAPLMSAEEYPSSLLKLLRKIEKSYPNSIYAFHLGGAYINSNDEHETHGAIDLFDDPEEETALLIKPVLKNIAQFVKEADGQVRILLEISQGQLEEREKTRDDIKKFIDES